VPAEESANQAAVGKDGVTLADRIVDSGSRALNPQQLARVADGKVP
jgi:hypothetical protein